MPSESLVDVTASVGPDGTRTVVENVVAGGDLRSVFFERTFILGVLYRGELDRTLAVLEDAGAAIDARLGRDRPE